MKIEKREKTNSHKILKNSVYHISGQYIFRAKVGHMNINKKYLKIFF